MQGKGFNLQLPGVPPHVNALIKEATAESNASCPEDALPAAAEW